MFILSSNLIFIKFFGFLVENYNENSIYIIDISIKYSLSNCFGEDKKDAFHIFEFLQKNAP